MNEITKIIGRVKSMEKEQEEARLAHSKLTGQRESEINRLKSDFEVKGVKEAEKELDKLKKRIDNIDRQIIEKYKNIKEKYDVTPA